MSKQINQSGAFMPHQESRRAFASSLGVLNAELVLNVDGDSSASFFLNSGATTFNGTYVIEGSPDGINYIALLAFPYAPASVGGTIAPSAQPQVSESINAAFKRFLNVSCGGLQKIRVRISAYSTGSFACYANSESGDSINPYVRDQKAATLIVSTTGAASSAVTATLPAVAGLRHYIDRMSILRSVTAVQAASATPVVVSTTNMPSGLAFTFGVDAAQVGQDKEAVMDFGGAGLATVSANTATTVVAPAVAGVVWRINVAYRLGL